MLAHILTLILGAWLLVSPGVLGYTDPTAIRNDVWMGVAVVAFSSLSLISFARMRHANTAVGIWLVCAPWIAGYGYGDGRAALNNLLVGVLLIGASFLEVRSDERRTFRRVIL